MCKLLGTASRADVDNVVVLHRLVVGRPDLQHDNGSTLVDMFDKFEMCVGAQMLAQPYLKFLVTLLASFGIE